MNTKKEEYKEYGIRKLKKRQDNRSQRRIFYTVRGSFVRDDQSSLLFWGIYIYYNIEYHAAEEKAMDPAAISESRSRERYSALHESSLFQAPSNFILYPGVHRYPDSPVRQSSNGVVSWIIALHRWKLQQHAIDSLLPRRRSCRIATLLFMLSRDFTDVPSLRISLAHLGRTHAVIIVDHATPPRNWQFLQDSRKFWPA